MSDDRFGKAQVAGIFQRRSLQFPRRAGAPEGALCAGVRPLFNLLQDIFRTI
jgi:hypothetical protein